MRAVAAGRKLKTRPNTAQGYEVHTMDENYIIHYSKSRQMSKPEIIFDKSGSGTNGGVTHSSSKHKGSLRSKPQRNRRPSSASTGYAPPLTSSASTSLLGHQSQEATELTRATSSTVPGGRGVCKLGAICNLPLPPQTDQVYINDREEYETTIMSPGTEKNLNLLSSSSSEAENHNRLKKDQPPKCNGPNAKDTLSRTISNLSHAPSSVATTTLGGSKIESKVSAKRKAVEKRYYAKAIAIMVTGGIIFSVGIALAALYFAGYVKVTMAGPVCLSIGLLLSVCGIVWLPIIKTKLKRQQQIMSRTFSL